MKRSIAWLLTAVMMLSCLAVLPFSVGAESDIGTARPMGDTGLEVMHLDRGSSNGQPYMSGANKPFGYHIVLDSSKKLTGITVPEMATYGVNTNRGVVEVYTWQGDYASTVANDPVYTRELVNHRDHQNVEVNIPENLKLTGDLYFHVICKQGSGAGYTPWLSNGGAEAASPVEGKITKIEPYCDGKLSHAFVCYIEMADMTPTAAILHNTADFDFSFASNNAEVLVGTTEQVTVEDQSANGYLALTATGAAPAVQFKGVPNVTLDRADYLIVKYRTRTEGKGALTIGRSDNDTNKDSVEWSYVADGTWHAILLDASDLWGKDSSVSLTGLTLNVLTTEAADAQVDLAYVYLFGDKVYAQSFMTTEQQAIKEDLNAALADSRVYDFGDDKEITYTAGADALVMVTDEALRVLSAGKDPYVTITTTKSASYRFVKIGYRTETANTSLSVSVGGNAAASASLIADGKWHEVVLELDVTGLSQLGNLRVDLPDGTTSEKDWVDVAYVGLFNSADKAAWYEYDTGFTTRKYAVVDDHVPVYNTTKSETGSRFGTLGKTYGQKFVSNADVTGIMVPKNAMYQGTEKNNKGTMKVWAWNTDYATTVAGTPLHVEELDGLADKTDLRVVFDAALPAGAYYFEVEMTTPAKGSYAAWTSTGVEKDGVDSYCGGELVENQALCAAYLVAGLGIEDQGHEYANDKTIYVDFTKYNENTTEALGLTGVAGVTVTELSDKGYITLAGSGAEATLTVPVKGAPMASTADWVVVRYRAASDGSAEATLTAVTEGEDALTASWAWNADGQWHVEVISAGDAWTVASGEKVLAVTLSGFGDVDLADMSFFANAEAAQAYADALSVEPAAPVNPADAKPVLLIDGEKLNMTNAVNCNMAIYDYDSGSLVLEAKGANPYYLVLPGATEVAPYLAIRYRVRSNMALQGNYYLGSIQSSAYGGGDFGTISYESDGEWHTTIVSLADLIDYDTDTNKVNYFRFDFLDADSVASGASVEIKYYAFFNTEADAYSFAHEEPTLAPLHTVVFDTGRVKVYGEFREDYTKEQVMEMAPPIYQVEGYTAAWEEFEIGTEDLVIHLIYTPVSDYDLNDEFANATVPTTGGASGGETETGDATTGDGAESTQAGQTSGGCQSVIAPAALLVVLSVVGGAVIGKKKD